MEISRPHAPLLRILAGLLIALPFLAISQTEVSRIRFTTLSKSTPGGLKSDLVRDLTQDLSGYLWLATDRGLSRFDGWETNHYFHDPDSPDSLSSDQLTAVATTQKTKGTVWVGTSSSGLVQFHQDSGNATRIKKGSVPGGELLSDSIVALAISNDQFLWIGTDAGLNVMNLSSGNISVAEGPLGSAGIASITNIGENEIWVGTAAGELYQWKNKENAFAKIWTTSVPVNSVALDAENRIWIGTGGLGLFSYAPGSGNEPVNHPVEGKNITSLFVDSNGDLWVGSMSGLALFDRENDSFIHFVNTPRHADSLTDNHVSSIFEDHSRMLWISTFGGGTSRFSLDRQWFSHIRFNPDRKDGLPHSSVRSFARTRDKSIWIGTSEGLTQWNTRDDRFQPLSNTEAEFRPDVNDLLYDQQDNLWIATRGTGLYRRGSDGITTAFRHSSDDAGSIGHDNISALLQNTEGVLFVGTSGAGLYRYDPGQQTFNRIKAESGKAVDFITDLSEDSNGHLWIAGKSDSFLLRKGSAELTDLATAFPNAEKQTSQRVTTILPDSNGIVWIGTLDAGLDRFNTVTGEISNFNSAVNGLPDDMILSLIKDESNFLWVATGTGIARLNAMQNEFRIFSEEDGLQKEGFNSGAVSKDEKGRLFFGGRDGFNIIDPANLPTMPRTPNPILTSFEYFGEQVIPKEGGILEREIAATDEIRIPFDERVRFAIRFANLDYRFPNRGYFRYMLEGYEQGWQIAEDDRRASYSNLPPGKYRFMVQSSIDGREWPDVGAKVRIVINPPLWQTWWFRSLALALLILGTVVITKITIRTRVKQLERREEMLRAQRDKAEAALARQLQNRMLLDKTTRNLQSDVPDDQILSDALQQITVEFQATHCLVHRLVSIEGEDGGTSNHLKQIGYWETQRGSIQSIKPTLWMEDLLVKRILEARTVLSVSNPLEIPDSLRASFSPNEPVSLLAAKTSFLDNANGLIVLLRVGNNSPWTEDDFKLLEALTGQFGISIAQISTSETEERYHHHLEEARHLAEVANRAKSDFLAKMTHELRTPLNSIIGFSEILGEDKTLNPKQRETLDIINNSGEHLLDVINEILDLSKIEAGKMEKNEETFEFLPLLGSVYEMLSLKAEAKRIAFNFSAQSNLPVEIISDRSKLRQILINLIGNAIKFTAQGAVSLTISSKEISAPELVEGRLRRGIRLHFEIRDTGRGIREDEIENLFERYSQTESGRRSSEGTGLGLPIARSFVQMLGGDIEVTSVFGEGTTFRFSIECDELAPAKTEAHHLGITLNEKTAQRISGFTSPHREVRILIAEDQPTNRLLLKRILGKAGFVLAEAENGQEAVDKWNEWHPHLILMDEDMPVKKGSDATREIKSLATSENDPIIISLTAYALEQAKLSALAAGCTDFVAKPFRSHELFSVISKHLGLEYTFNEAA